MSKGFGVTMADDQSYGKSRIGSLTEDDVRRLATQAICVLSQSSITAMKAPDTYVRALHEAVLSGVEDSRHKVVARMLRDGITPTQVIDHYIPEVARWLGQEWADDELSFAEVSLGSARLQELVRRAAAARKMPDETARSATRQPRVLLIVPRPEHHSLGVFVAGDQLRRYGYTVDIVVDEHPNHVAQRVRNQRYVMVGITIAGRRTLASAKELVEKIRTATTRATPIVLGGSLTETSIDLKRVTGVDHVVTDVRDALERCGLDITEADPPLGSKAGHTSVFG